MRPALLLVALLVLCQCPASLSQAAGEWRARATTPTSRHRSASRLPPLRRLTSLIPPAPQKHQNCAKAVNEFVTDEDVPAVFNLEPRGGSSYKLLCAPKRSDPEPTVEAATVRNTPSLPLPTSPPGLPSHHDAHHTRCLLEISRPKNNIKNSHKPSWCFGRARCTITPARASGRRRTRSATSGVRGAGADRPRQRRPGGLYTLKSADPFSHVVP